MNQTRIEEGTLFSVPLNDGRYALGLVARRAPQKGKTWGVFGYFFGPFANIPSSLALTGRMHKESATVLLNCGALHFHSGKWKILGKLEPWNRDIWPLPDFFRYERHTGRFFCVRYDERDLVTAISETPMVDSGGLPEDGLYGAEAAEIYLTKIMSDFPSRDRLS